MKTSVIITAVATVVVIAAIIVLVVPRIIIIKAEQARTACETNLRSIAQACRVYATDNAGSFPDALSDLFPKYAGRTKLFVHLANEKNIGDVKDVDRWSDYAVFPGRRTSDPPDTVLLYEKANAFVGSHVHGSHVVTVDGRIIWQRAGGGK